MKKQLEFANKKQIPYVAFVGENEMTNGSVTLKEMGSGMQTTMSLDEAVGRLK